MRNAARDPILILKRILTTVYTTTQTYKLQASQISPGQNADVAAVLYLYQYGMPCDRDDGRQQQASLETRKILFLLQISFIRCDKMEPLILK